MEADYDNFEIARVIHGYKLVDSESYERQYASADGLPLVPGYYVVYWSAQIKVRRFNKEARFYGPFRVRQEAWDFLERSRTELSIASEFSGFDPIISQSIAPSAAISNPAVHPGPSAPA